MSVMVLQDARMKAAPVEAAVGTRTLDFYAAAFSTTPDKNGDLVDPHSCDEWLKTFYGKGKPLPISFAHAAVRNDMNPFEIIGYAPADADHVWVDDYGLRVKAYIDVVDNDTARQVASLVDRGIVTGASIAFIAVREKRRRDGAAVITKMQILEAGPCLTPANDEAVVLGIKSDQSGAETTDDEREVETTDAEDVKTTEVEPEPDADAKSALRAAASVGMSAGMSAEDRQDVIDALASAAEVKHGGAPGHLQNAHDALVRAGAKCAGDDERQKNQGDDVDDALRRIRIMKSSILR